jgi:hypothetical protein
MATPIIPTSMDLNNRDTILSDKFGEMLDQWREIEDILTQGQKDQLAKLEKLRQLTKDYTKKEELLNQTSYSPLAKKAMILRDKMAFKLSKYVNNKYLDKILKGIIAISKGVAQMAKNSFMKLLGFLMMMAIFDPKGTLLRSILKFLIGMVVWLIRIIASMLPDLIRTMMDLVTNVFPDILRDIVQTFFPIIGQIFKKLSKDLEKDFPILSWIVGLIGDAFGPDGILYKFGTALAGMLPILLAGFLILGAIMKFLPILMGIFTVLKWVFIGFKFLMILIGAIVGLPAWLVAIIVIAIVAIGVLIWKYWDQIKAFFVMIGGYIMGFASWWWNTTKKGARIIMDIVMWPIKTLMKIIKWLIKELPKLLSKLGKSIWATVERIFSGILRALFAPMRFIFDAFRAIARVLAPVVRPLLSALQSIWDLIKDKIVKVFGWIKRTFQYFADMFSAMGAFGIVDFLKASSQERAVMMNAVQLSNVRGWDIGAIARGDVATPQELQNMGISRSITPGSVGFATPTMNAQTASAQANARNIIDQSPQYKEETATR